MRGSPNGSRPMVPGSILMFDEFCNHEEFRVFNDYVGAYTR